MTKTFEINRQIMIDAPAEVVRGLIHDLHKWPSWSPWEDLDPNLQRTYSGPDRGVRAYYAWVGNKKAGQGSMVITTDEPGLVGLDLHYEKPFRAHNQVEFHLVPAGQATNVLWKVTGQMNLGMQIFNKIQPLDRLMGADFEKGLARLKEVSESQAH